jgi:hypothetical protein
VPVVGGSAAELMLIGLATPPLATSARWRVAPNPLSLFGIVVGIALRPGSGCDHVKRGLTTFRTGIAIPNIRPVQWTTTTA